ncbi:hypothetical protein VDG1235_2254 [Verrucomicrobiia bacterium DG1235]|nr:hypothetical protein VDG1235_2254 [Verrucomicrobiae bacterium DG1235]
MKRFGTLVFAVVGIALATLGQSAPSAYVDGEGVFRWTDTDEELALFGVNYTTPFAHAFRAHKRLGVSWKEAIDADVYHFARLGFDAYRIHVWDREISDQQGNLVVNEHVEAFDYLLAKLKERGIKIILTPLQFGNAAYPEGGVPLDGFSSNYGKQGSLEDKTSWPLQERYLEQFVSHVNPNTGLAYKDDPDIIAFEICNEPGHFEYDLTVEYINRMARAIRGTGSEKPIFYNMSHGLDVYEAYLDADVQGGTFQWYPANLVAGHEQRGNFLPYVDNYDIPFADHPKFQKKAKMVYEFDAADIGRSYIYPAISRSYRTAGMQFATMFAYDPIHIAPFNSEYQTHYMNLAYAPSKTLGLMVAAEAFRRVPRGADYGDYPHNMEFAGARVSYADDLAEFVSDESFLYSNSTSKKLDSLNTLSQIAGYGNSSVVEYPGFGSYFLDRIEEGVWRLEVMPDAVWVRDPYEKPNPEKHVSRISWNEWPIRIGLPDLGEAFSVKGLNKGNANKAKASGGAFLVRPGAYLLVRDGSKSKLKASTPWKTITLGEYVAPPASIDKTYILHEPLVEVVTDRDLSVKATIVSNKAIAGVQLVAYLPEPPYVPEPVVANPARQQPGGGNTPGVGTRNTGGATAYEMKHVSGFEYVAVIPAEELHSGAVRYHIVVDEAGAKRSFPSEMKGVPTDWSFYGDGWLARLVDSKDPVLLFEAEEDHGGLTGNGRYARYPLVASERQGTDAIEVVARDLQRDKFDHSLRFYFKDKIAPRIQDLGATSQLRFFGKSATGEPSKVQLALITEDGIAYGAQVAVSPEHGVVSIPLDSLQQVRAPNIPHGYPVYIDFWSSVEESIPLEIERVECVLISIGPGISEEEAKEPQGVQIERIWLD